MLGYLVGLDLFPLSINTVIIVYSVFMEISGQTRNEWLRKGSKVMKQFETTSCLPNLQGEQRTTVRGLLRVQPFTPKLVNGKTYWITRAEVSVRTALGNSTRAMGIILDKIKGREYALSVADFNRFMETGDLSLLPKG
jgi:hypothetical protein